MNVAAIQTLKSSLSALSSNDQTFATSLVKQYTRNGGSLSDKQWYWINILADRASKPAAPKPTENVGDMTGLINLFGNIKTHLKDPKIHLQTPEGQPVEISVAGSGAKVPGSINVTDGGPFGRNTWFGRVHANGTWEKGMKPTAATMTSVRALLIKLSDAPAATAAEYGQLTGRCCFCNKKLTDERSKAVGYGETCASNYNLPWGKTC